MQKAVLLTLTILLAVFLFNAASADQALTITLDPPQKTDKEQAQNDLRLKHETLGATRTESEKQQSRAQSSGQPDKKEVTIGRVGIVTASKAAIRSNPGSRGRRLYTCAKDTYLAIVGEKGSWYGCLMSDSSTGWIEKSKVSLLDYQVVGQASQTTSQGRQIVNTALRYLGLPYKWGGYSLNGLDCSGFVKAVFASNGIDLPRVSRDQAAVGMPVAWSQLQPGDRLYFACKGGQIDHTGIYMGNGLFIHSSVSRGGVTVESIFKPFYTNSLVIARR